MQVHVEVAQALALQQYLFGLCSSNAFQEAGAHN